MMKSGVGEALQQYRQHSNLRIAASAKTTRKLMIEQMQAQAKQTNALKSTTEVPVQIVSRIDTSVTSSSTNVDNISLDSQQLDLHKE